jgi:hypothetical protein
MPNIFLLKDSGGLIMINLNINRAFVMKTFRCPDYFRTEGLSIKTNKPRNEFPNANIIVSIFRMYKKNPEKPQELIKVNERGLL